VTSIARDLLHATMTSRVRFVPETALSGADHCRSQLARHITAG